MGEKGRPKIVYRDGVTHFPWGAEDFGVNQARRLASSLGEFLTKECGVKITPFLLLTFPGWWVEEVSVDADLIVCNPGQIGHHLKGVNTLPLKAEIRQRIVEKLREKASL